MPLPCFIKKTRARISLKYDTIIIGAGIAGASAALALANKERILLVEAREPAAGASGVAGGLFSPMLALRGRPIWRIDEAIEAFEQQLDVCDGWSLYDNRGVLRPAHDEQQQTFFLQSVEKWPLFAEWLSPEACRERFPLINAPYGSMYIPRAGAINLAQYVRHLVAAAASRGVEVRTNAPVTDWGENADGAFVCIDCSSNPPEPIHAKRLVICCGKGLFSPPFRSSLDVHAVKGQTIRITIPEGLSFADIVPTSGKGYIIPEKDHLAIGSSFHHTFDDEKPSEAVSAELLQKGIYMLPALKTSHVMDSQVGIRVSVPGIRLPLLGRFPGYEKVWVFSAFGSKGLLLSPLLAAHLFSYLHDPSTIPSELHPRLQK